MTDNKITHAELVERGARWLKNTLHCRVVFKELVAFTSYGEIPDVIGWVNGKSILVECKTSVADFKKDLCKPSRQYMHKGLGCWRFYLTPPGLLDNQEIPVGWGLYEVHGRLVKHIRGMEYSNCAITPNQSHKDSEIAMLLSALARRKNER